MHTFDIARKEKFMPAHLNSALTFGRRFVSSTPALLVIIGLVALTALAMNARSWYAQTAVAEKPGIAMSQEQSAHTEPTPVRMQAELIVITQTGFSPSDISRPQGGFLLTVSNRSDLEELRLRLDREGGDRLRDVQVSRPKKDWRDAAFLPPGNYTLTEASHPDWVCRITITAR
jgi:hypothetical protein